MQKTFKAVRSGDVDAVKKILDAHPEEIKAVAKQPPKKDEGQSLHQVALKSGNLDVANLLLDYDADINFMEAEDCGSQWRMPVLHDAIRCAVMSSRWNVKDYVNGGYITHSSAAEAEKSFLLLKRMLEMGADIQARDSYGNSALQRAILDVRQVLPSYNHAAQSIGDDRVITEELRQDITRVFKLLYKHGADKQEVNRISGKTMEECYSAEPVAAFINV